MNGTHDLVYAEFRPDSTTPLLRANTNFTLVWRAVPRSYSR